MSRRNRLRIAALLVVVVALVMTTAACGGSSKKPQSAQKQAQKGNADLQSQTYVTKNNTEFVHYNWRQELSDDPATILWCTFFPPGISGVTDGSTPGQAITVPIAGKLTSSNKRPYSDIKYWDAGNYSWYPLEVPGPDKMFGGSSEYRYGFGPAGKADYQDFTGLSSYCTTQPKVWQSNTIIVTSTDATLQSITLAAEAALKAGDAVKAKQILDQAGNVTKAKP